MAINEQKEFLPIDPESVRWGKYANYGGGIAYAKGRGQYEGVIFIHIGNIGNLEETSRQAKFDSRLPRHPFVVGVGIDGKRSERAGKPVYNLYKLGEWRTPWWRIDQDTLALLGMKSEDLHLLNRDNFRRITTPSGGEGIEL